MSVPLPPRKRAKKRRRPQGQPRVLVDARWLEEPGGWHVSFEWYLDDLQAEPDGVEVMAWSASTLATVTRLAEVLDAVRHRARPPVGGETLDLRDPGRD